MISISKNIISAMLKNIELKTKKIIIFSLIPFLFIIIFGFCLLGVFTSPKLSAVSTSPRITSLYTNNYGSYQQGSNVNIQWSIAEPVPYGEWFIGLYSSAGNYYDYTVISAGNGSNSTSFNYNLPITSAPVGSGYRAVIAYRATANDSWISVTSSSNTFEITASGSSTTGNTGTIPTTVTAPTINNLSVSSSSNFKIGSSATIQWTTTQPVASGEWFVSLYSSAGVYYDYIVSTTGIGSGSTSFNYNLPITSAPVGSGYRAVVAYRATANDSWTSVTSSSNTFAITSGTAPISTTPTIRTLVASGSGSYEQQSVVTIQWTTSQAVASGEWFVGLYSSTGTYYDYVTTNTGIGTGSISFSYNLPISTATPIGSGYRAVVAYRANANSSWVNVTSSSTTFNVIAPALTTTTQDKVVGRVVTNSLCKVNANNVPNSLLSLDTVKQMAANCKKYLPLVETFLGKSTCKFTETNKLNILFNDNYKNIGVALTVGCTIQYQISNISQNNSSTLPHEITHTVQNFPKSPPYYLGEATASYMAHYFGFQDSAAGNAAPKSPYGYCLASDWLNFRYDRGYNCGAVYLKYIEKTYSPNIVKNIHNIIKNGQAKGKTIDILEKEIDTLIINSTKSNSNPSGLTREQVYQKCLMVDPVVNGGVGCFGGRQ